MVSKSDIDKALAKRRKVITKNLVHSVESYSDWRAREELPLWANSIEDLDEKIKRLQNAICKLKRGGGIGLERTHEPIEIEHRTYDKLKYSPATGAFFGKANNVDAGFGNIVVRRCIRPGSTIFTYPNSELLLADLGVIELPQRDLQKKYGCSIRTLDDLIEQAVELDDPNVLYTELQRRAVRIIRRIFRPDVIHFSREDDLVHDQYIVLYLDALAATARPLNDAKVAA